MTARPPPDRQLNIEETPRNINKLFIKKENKFMRHSFGIYDENYKDSCREKYYLTAKEATNEMACAYEYYCRECGCKFWGHIHSLDDIDNVICPTCGTIGTYPLSFVEPTGNKMRKGNNRIEREEGVCFDEKMQLALAFQSMDALVDLFLPNENETAPNLTRLTKKDDINYLLENHLEEYYEWIPDCGHSIYAIPSDCMKGIDKVKNIDSEILCPFPLDYVKEKGFERYGKYIVCEGKLDEEYGLRINNNGKSYSRWD